MRRGKTRPGAALPAERKNFEGIWLAKSGESRYNIVVACAYGKSKRGSAKKVSGKPEERMRK